jgi:hypothetical protein
MCVCVCDQYVNLYVHTWTNYVYTGVRGHVSYPYNIADTTTESNLYTQHMERQKILN